MPDRTPYIAGNWKMHKTGVEARALAGDLRPLVAEAQGVEVGLCVPFTAIREVAEAAAGTGWHIAGQNMHAAAEGAFTGEVSAPMLLEAGADSVVLGHSERRQLFGETDAALKEKVPAALATGLQPIFCVGETEDERDRDQTETRLRTQVEAGLERLADERLADVVIAYEPVWAIGTGRVATTEQAQEACAFIRGLVAERDEGAASAVRVLYGGSVKPDNCVEIVACADVDGALVGGASLDPEGFAAIVNSSR